MSSIKWASLNDPLKTQHKSLGKQFQALAWHKATPASLWSSSWNESNIKNLHKPQCCLNLNVTNYKLKGVHCQLSHFQRPIQDISSEILTKQCNRCILGTRCLPGVVIIGWKTFFQAAQIHRRLTNNSSAVWLRTTTQNRALSSSLLLLLAFLHGHNQPFFRSSLNFHSRFLLVIGHRDINFTCPAGT